MTATIFAGDAIIGARDEQQDARALGLARVAGGRCAQLAVVADGMGGHSGGAIASVAAIEAFMAAAAAGGWESYAEVLRGALTAANGAIARRIGDDRHLDGMGCTLVAAVFDPRAVHYISVGDSLLLRVAGGGVERLNADHSMTPLLDAAGAPADDPQRHMLRSALTGEQITLIDEGEVVVTENSLFVLATDGLLTLDAPTLLGIIESAPLVTPASLVQRLLARVIAEQRPDQDNCTVVVARIETSAGGRRWVRAAAGLLLVAGGTGALALAWWGLTHHRQPVIRVWPTPVAAPSSSPSPRREPYAVAAPMLARDPARHPSLSTHLPARTPAPASMATASPRARVPDTLEAIINALPVDEEVTDGNQSSPTLVPPPGHHTR